jgi:hypothetical protein
MSLELMCALTQPSVAAYSTASVREENTCSYRVQLPSIAGCPLQCRAPGDTALCSGNGVCGFNTDAGASQCYCYAGWSGGLCASAIPSTSGLGVEGVFLIIVCVVLAGVLGLVAFMVVKLRKLAVNPAAYAELQGKCESCAGAERSEKTAGVLPCSCRGSTSRLAAAAGRHVGLRVAVVCVRCT